VGREGPEEDLREQIVPSIVLLVRQQEGFVAMEVTPMARAGGWLKIVSDIRREGADSRPEKSLNQVWLLASPPLECNVLLVPDDCTALCVVTSARHFLALLQVRSGSLDPALGGMKNRETTRVGAFAVRLG